MDRGRENKEDLSHEDPRSMTHGCRLNVTNTVARRIREPLLRRQRVDADAATPAAAVAGVLDDDGAADDDYDDDEGPAVQLSHCSLPLRR